MGDLGVNSPEIAGQTRVPWGSVLKKNPPAAGFEEQKYCSKPDEGTLVICIYFFHRAGARAPGDLLRCSAERALTVCITQYIVRSIDY